MVTQDFTLAKLAIITWRYLYLLKMRICDSLKVMTKSVLPSVTTQMFPTTWSSWALYKGYGMYTIHNLHPLYISGSTLLIQHSYTELQGTLTVWWSLHLATALLHCSTSHTSTVLLWQLCFFRRPISVFQMLCVVSLTPKQLRYCALQLGCHRLTLRMILFQA